MSRNRCTECGTTHPKWAGRCPSCGAWNTLVEEATPGRSGRAAVAATARPITEIVAAAAHPVPTGLSELDRVLGGGLVPGSVTVVGGEPGMGSRRSYPPNSCPSVTGVASIRLGSAALDDGGELICLALER